VTDARPAPLPSAPGRLERSALAQLTLARVRGFFREPSAVFWTFAFPVLLTIALGSLCASFLNAASNAINQIYDLEIDRVNKPGRPLVTGELSMREGWLATWIWYALALIPTWLVVVYPWNSWSQKLFAPLQYHECFFIYLAGFVFTMVYSVPSWGRTKRFGIWANITIAIPRGCLLKVAGWSMVAHVYSIEPWFIGSIFMLFLIGAASTKDYSDIEGDRAGGCMTLPIQYGVRRAAWMISPSFVLPFLMIPAGAWAGVLTGNFWLLQLLGAVMTAYGLYVCYLMLRRPEDLAVEENHVSWAHMYRMMFVAQVGFALAYLL
jgi:4-hydroxybenzoate polyprenyltransferase